MARLEKKIERFEALRELMDRLCAPDLMLPEAAVLRNRLSVLLAQPDEAEEGDGDVGLDLDRESRPWSFVTTPPRIEKGRAGFRSPRCTPCLTGC